MSAELVVSVSEFVALLNQTLEFAYPSIIIAGELANFRVSKNKWLYFDLKDDFASVKFFGTVYQLPGPLEDGMLLEVRGQPQLHPLYGFSVNVQSIRPVGEGSIKRAAALLEAKLVAEGLFDEARKRPLLYPPEHIGLITSSEAAAYSDFMKILDERWRGITVDFMNVQVQGELAVTQIVQAIERFNALAEPPEVLVITRGGGSADDLAAFSTEQVTRAVAASRVPTLVAVGHERDVSLAELAADRRASTPSNAAELLTPDRRHVIDQLSQISQQLATGLNDLLADNQRQLQVIDEAFDEIIGRTLHSAQDRLKLNQQVLEAFNPEAAFKRGWATVRHHNTLIRSGQSLAAGDIVDIRLYDASLKAQIDNIIMKDDR